MGEVLRVSASYVSEKGFKKCKFPFFTYMTYGDYFPC